MLNQVREKEWRGDFIVKCRDYRDSIQNVGTGFAYRGAHRYARVRIKEREREKGRIASSYLIYTYYIERRAIGCLARGTRTRVAVPVVAVQVIAAASLVSAGR